MTDEDAFCIEATEQHNLCKNAVLDVFKANNISFWESLAILGHLFGQAAAHTNSDPTDALHTIAMNFQVGYNSMLEQETIQ